MSGARARQGPRLLELSSSDGAEESYTGLSELYSDIDTSSTSEAWRAACPPIIRAEVPKDERQ